MAAKSTLYITYKHQNWTFGDKQSLVPLLDGDDDYIIETVASSTDFAVVLRNGKTYRVKDTEEEAQKFIAVMYRYYSVEQNTEKECFIDRADSKKRFLTSGDAMAAGVYDYVYVPTGNYFVSREGKIMSAFKTEEEAFNFMYEHEGVCYTYIC